jgi:hypothetical protein
VSAPVEQGACVADVLSRAAGLIEPEGAWTQGAYAVSEDGIAEDDDHNWPDDPTCFCVLEPSLGFKI